MKGFSVFLICLATLIALFGINSTAKSFSFENYLTEISVVAENRPEMPSTEKINKVILSFEEDGKDTQTKILQVVRAIWNSIKLIYECLVFAVRFIVYILEMLIYVINIASACVYNLLVW